MADNKRTRNYDNLHRNPDYAVICSFLNKFSSLLNSPGITFENLERWISEQRPCSSTFKDFLLTLLKRWRSSANDERFSKYLLKFCESYSPSDATNLEKFGLERCSADIKLRLVKNLVEQQFDTNIKFKDKVNMISADELRVQPIGRDIMGRVYWSFMDCDMNLRIFCGELPFEGIEGNSSGLKWEIIARNRVELSELISSLEKSDLTIEKLLPTFNINNDEEDDDRNGQKFDNNVLESGVKVESGENGNDLKEEHHYINDCTEKTSISTFQATDTDGGSNSGIIDGDNDNNKSKNVMPNNKLVFSNEKDDVIRSPLTEVESILTNSMTGTELKANNIKKNDDIDGENVDISRKLFSDNELLTANNADPIENKTLENIDSNVKEGSDKQFVDKQNHIDFIGAQKPSKMCDPVAPTQEISILSDNIDIRPCFSADENHVKEALHEKLDAHVLRSDCLEKSQTRAVVEMSMTTVKNEHHLSLFKDLNTCEFWKEFRRHRGKYYLPHSDTKQEFGAGVMSTELSVGVAATFIDQTKSNIRFSEKRFQTLTKRKRGFMFSACSDLVNEKRKGISDSELSESSLESGLDNSEALSSAPEDGPPTKRQRNKALINRLRRNKLHDQVLRTKNQIYFGGISDDQSATNRSSSCCMHGEAPLTVVEYSLSTCKAESHNTINGKNCENEIESSNGEKEAEVDQYEDHSTIKLVQESDSNNSKLRSVGKSDAGAAIDHISHIKENSIKEIISDDLFVIDKALFLQDDSWNVANQSILATDSLSESLIKNTETFPLDELDILISIKGKDGCDIGGNGNNYDLSILPIQDVEQPPTFTEEDLGGFSGKNCECSKSSSHIDEKIFDLPDDDDDEHERTTKSGIKELKELGLKLEKDKEICDHDCPDALKICCEPIDAISCDNNKVGNDEIQKENTLHQTTNIQAPIHECGDNSNGPTNIQAPINECGDNSNGPTNIQAPIHECGDNSNGPTNIQAPIHECGDNSNGPTNIQAPINECGDNSNGPTNIQTPINECGDNSNGPTNIQTPINECGDNSNGPTNIQAPINECGDNSNGPTSECCGEGEAITEAGNLQNFPEGIEKVEYHKKSKKINICNEESSLDFVELRRSSRVNKGQRKVEMLELEFPSRKRKKKDEELTSEERMKKQADKERRRTEKMMRQMAEEYEELLQARKDKKKRFKMINDDDDNDEDFVPGMRRGLRGKRRKKYNDDDDEDDENDDDSLSDVNGGIDGDWDECYTLGTQSSTSDEEVLVLESDGSIYEPTGRNARRVASLKSVLDNADQAGVDQQCLVCDKKSEPEFMLLCDKCDGGYHTWCLRPTLHIIPDGDWFCSPCEHKMLLERLHEQLCDYDEKAKLNIKLTNRKERLAFINISLNNILMEKDMKEVAEKLEETEGRGRINRSSEENGDDDDNDYCIVKSNIKKMTSKGDNNTKKLMRNYDSDDEKASFSFQINDGDDDDDDDVNIQTKKKSSKKRNRLSSSSESDVVTDVDADDDDDDDDDGKLSKKITFTNQRKIRDLDIANVCGNKHKKANRKRRCFDSDDDDDEEEVEGDWLVTRRSRRQRKDISYKFEEYENLISGAIEDDVKETYGAGNYGRGKDMANITGAKNNSTTSPTTNIKKRKKKKKFSVLDSDDDGGNDDDDDDDSEEFKIDDASVDEDEDDAATESEHSEIGEGEIVSRKGEDLLSRKSKRNKRKSRIYDDFVIEEEELFTKTSKRIPARRAAARKGINYNEHSGDENDDETSVKRLKNSNESRRESPSSVAISGSCHEDESKNDRKKHDRDKDGDYMEDDEDEDDEEDDFTPGYKDSYSDDDLRDFIKSGSSSSSSSVCSLSPLHKLSRKRTSVVKQQKKKKKTSNMSAEKNKRQRKVVGGINENKRKTKITKKKRKRKPWYTSDSDEEEEDDVSVTRDSYSDDDFSCYTEPTPQKRADRRALRYKDEEAIAEDKLSESVVPPSSDTLIQSSASPVLQVIVAGDSESTKMNVIHSLQPISTSHQVDISVQQLASPIPHVTVAVQRLNSSYPLTTSIGQLIMSTHSPQISVIGKRVSTPHFQTATVSLVQSTVSTSLPQFAGEPQAADLSCNVPLPALQAITTQRVSSFVPHIAGQRLISQHPFTLSATAHFPGASTISCPRTVPPLPPLYPIVKNNYLMNAPIAMAMRSGMTSFGGVCSIIPPSSLRGQKMVDEQVLVNSFNEKLSSFSVRNITSVAPRGFKPPYGAGPPEEDFLVQDITEFLNTDQANL